MGETQQDPLCSHTGVHAVSSLFSLQNSASMALSLVAPQLSSVGGPQHFALPQHSAC